jgi:hypothetical protein
MFSRLRNMRRTLWSLGVGVSVTASVAGLVWFYGRGPLPPAPVPEPPLPTAAPTHFLNTDAQFIGNGACAKCHTEKNDSYLRTAHSQTLADVGTHGVPGKNESPGDGEPPDTSFVHELSGRTYRVYRRDNRMHHEEVVRAADGTEIARVDIPVRYRLGSGDFGRAYLVEIDGFLQQSPIGWYTSKKKWGMSPGYDAPQHQGFERSVGTDCLRCHAGLAEAVAGTVHRIIVREKAIGCESCHGPGSLHQELHRSRTAKLDNADDLTIVNPQKLERPLQEAICATCHLDDAATIAVRGQQIVDFRPGRPLTDVRVDYRLATLNHQTTVAGHTAQLHDSACYQKSPGMTCLTCHKQHARERPKDPVAYYRKKCLTCHTIEACRLPPAARLKKDANDNCVACHMPRGAIDVPHVAFTNHRIGGHAPPQAADSGQVPELAPIYDVSRLPPLDQHRNLGLAYMMAADKPPFAEFADEFRFRAIRLLEGVWAAGLRDPQTAAACADFYFGKDRERYRAYLRHVLESKAVPAPMRAYALSNLATLAAQEGDHKTAVGLLEQLMVMRRVSEDWRLLGISHGGNGEPLKALSALNRALEMRPYRPVTHAALADLYHELGDVQHAGEHQEKAGWLFKHQQD